MLDGYKDGGRKVGSKRYLGSANLLGAKNGSFITIVIAQGADAIIVVADDFEFLEAIRDLTKKINELVPGTSLTPQQFVEIALKADGLSTSKLDGELFVDSYHLRGQEPSLFEKAIPLELVRRNGHDGDTLFSDAASGTAAYYLSLDDEPDDAIAAVINPHDHRYLEGIRSIFRDAGRGENIRDQLSEILLQEFVRVTGQAKINTHLYMKLTQEGHGLDYVLGDAENTVSLQHLTR